MKTITSPIIKNLIYITFIGVTLCHCYLFMSMKNHNNICLYSYIYTFNLYNTHYTKYASIDYFYKFATTS